IRLFEQAAPAWKLDSDDLLMLAWAARLHEVGLVIAHSQYQVHGAYVIEHSDIAGFSRQEQQFLGALVRTHRRRVPKSAFDALPDRLLDSARRSAALLRISALLHRARDADEIPRLDLEVAGSRLILRMDRRWLEMRPLLRADLESEPADIASLGIDLAIVAN